MKSLIRKKVMLLLLAVLTMGLTAQNSRGQGLTNKESEEHLYAWAPGFNLMPEPKQQNIYTSSVQYKPEDYEKRYVYAYALLDSDDGVSHYVITPVYEVTVRWNYTEAAEQKLEEKLRDHIQKDMGKSVLRMTSNGRAFEKRVEADDSRDEVIRDFVQYEDKISDPGYNFSFRYDQREYDK